MSWMASVRDFSRENLLIFLDLRQQRVFGIGGLV
jgi:hypothetical protein